MCGTVVCMAVVMGVCVFEGYGVWLVVCVHVVSGAVMCARLMIGAMVSGAVVCRVVVCGVAVCVCGGGGGGGV